MAIQPRITSNLWFDTNAQEAVNYYISIFKNSSIKRVTYYGKEGHEIHQMPEGMVLTIEFELDGVDFLALNGGPIFKFNEAISLMVNCETQEEIDYYWNQLTQDGDPEAQQCGWLKDKYGVSWQVAPVVLREMLADTEKGRSERVMKVMMQMKKIDIAALERAYGED